MFENFKTFETTYAGRPVVVETGKTCGLANGSCWVRYGETVQLPQSQERVLTFSHFQLTLRRKCMQ